MDLQSQCDAAGAADVGAVSRVAILLSTFNGERYLPEQLASFVAQTHADWVLYWRDDGSSDASAAVMAGFAGGPGCGRCVAVPDGGHMQVTGSFLALLRAALVHGVPAGAPLGAPVRHAVLREALGRDAVVREALVREPGVREALVREAGVREAGVRDALVRDTLVREAGVREASVDASLDAAEGGPAAFFAFSDQDDVWLPDKLANGVAALGRHADRPALWFCGRTLVDASLEPLGQVLAPRRPPGFPAALTQNLAPGCCMMLNRAAAALIDAAAVPQGSWHDWWAYALVSASGGAVIAGDTADILYRQHNLNLVGEPRDFWHRIVAAARRGPGPFMAIFWRHVAALRSVPNTLPEATRAQLDCIEAARRGGLVARFRAIGLPGLVRQTWVETLLFRLWFLLG